MVFSRTFLSLVAAIACSGSLAQGSSSTSSGQGQRYEPTRPGQVADINGMMVRYVDHTQYGQARNGRSDHYERRQRFEPTRPWQLANNKTTQIPRIDRPRYEPTRPNRLSNQQHSPRRSRNNQWEVAYNHYDQLTSAQNNYKRWDSRYGDYQKTKKWHQKVAKGGKRLFKPVKFAFKLSKKAVTKATFGWLPLL